MADPPIDPAKVKAAQAGTVRARAAVVRALQDVWFRYALAELLSVSAARDATQEAGLRVLSRLSSFDHAEPIEAWSMGAAVAAVRDVRALDGRPPPLLATARGAGLSADPPPFRRQLADVAEGLSAVLTPMTPDGRAAVVLRVIQGMPMDAVARSMGVDRRAARAALAGGLRAVPRPRRPAIDAVRDWSALARYPGDLRRELFRADRPRWLVPAAIGTLLGSVVVLSVVHHFRPPTTQPTTQPTTRPTTRPTTAIAAG